MNEKPNFSIAKENGYFFDLDDVWMDHINKEKDEQK